MAVAIIKQWKELNEANEEHKYNDKMRKIEKKLKIAIDRYVNNPIWTTTKPFRNPICSGKSAIWVVHSISICDTHYQMYSNFTKTME